MNIKYKDKKMKQIDDELYAEILKVLEKRAKKLYNKVLALDEVKQNDNGLEKARAVKTSKKKDEIEKAMLEIKSKGEKITKYKVHQITNIAYVTLSKYYDELLEKVNKIKVFM